MLKAIKDWQYNKNLKKILLDFLTEMDKNLETYYVMDQRQFITHGYLMDSWPLVKDMDLIKKHEEIKVYAQALLDFNSSYEEYKKFEQWYTSDLKHKTADNAKKLHQLKDSLQLKIKNFEVIIMSAGQIFEKELLSLGFIEN